MYNSLGISDFLQRKDLIEELQAEHYDVGFTEFFDYCPIGLLHHVGVKSVAILSAVPITDLLAYTWGIPSPSSYVTSMNFIDITKQEIPKIRRLIKLLKRLTLS